VKKINISLNVCIVNKGKGKGKYKFASVHDMKAYRWRMGLAALIFNLGPK
jgi:hypothetical protein